MRDQYKGQIMQGRIIFGKDTTHAQALFQMWLDDHNGKRVIITIDDPTSTQFRRFFEGAVVPYYAYQQHLFDQEQQVWRRFSFIEARENLKLEFNPSYLMGRGGKRQTVAGSTALLNKAQFGAFLEKIQHWFLENGYQFPNSEDHNKWMKTAPLVGEVYPPLKKIIELSDIKLTELQS